MFEKKYSLFTVILASVCSCLIVIGGVIAAISAKSEDVFHAYKFLKLMQNIQESYVEPVEKDVLYEGALAGMVEALDDKYSVYLDKKKFEALNNSTEGHFDGIGVVLGMKDDEFVVIAPLEGTPGEKAGIKSGDRIVAIDGKAIKGKSLEDVVNSIRGKRGTSVGITLLNKESEEVTVSVLRDEIKLQSVDGEMKDGKIGYIRVGMFNENTAGDFIQKYHELEKAGMQATILDLRGNPGGLLHSSLRIAELLVPKGPIVSTVGRDGKAQVEYSRLEKIKYPLAVLVDEGSASASEIVAGAVQDTEAGKLFGTKTFGKGTVQSVMRLGIDTGVKMTIARYFTPSGRSINGIGIEPDVVVEPTDERGTNQLQAAEDYLLEQLDK